MPGTGFLITNYLNQSIQVFISPPATPEFSFTGVLTNVAYTSTPQVDYLVLDDHTIIPFATVYAIIPA